MPTMTRSIPIALTIVLALSACGSSEDTAAGDEPTPAPTTASSSAPASTAASPTGEPAAEVPQTLDFTARTIDGDTFTGASLAGKPTVFWFWAAWCPTCRGEADSVTAVQRENADRVNVVGVAGLGSGDDAMRRFAQDTGIEGFPQLADDAGEVWQRFEVVSQQYYVLLDSTGKVVHKGSLSQADLRERVAELT
ncbi:TlpA family protein disulfide reductase [Salinispora pacifica]|uniref:TlpA family protein disulfide reductase n=1 Tax=Salinispora pacifica TaxID=351187 RepID=UPI00035F4CC6|nr:redoxin domain-containing protein [Salinispora pacifica]